MSVGSTLPRPAPCDTKELSPSGLHRNQSFGASQKSVLRGITEISPSGLHRNQSFGASQNLVLRGFTEISPSGLHRNQSFGASQKSALRGFMVSRSPKKRTTSTCKEPSTTYRNQSLGPSQNSVLRDWPRCRDHQKRAHVEPKSKKLAPTVLHRKQVSTPFFPPFLSYSHQSNLVSSNYQFQCKLER